MIRKLKPYEKVERVILTARRDNAGFRKEFVDDWSSDEYRNDYTFCVPDWDIEVVYGKTDKFNRVAAIVGEDKAAEVLDALG